MDRLLDPYRYKSSFTLTSVSYPVEVVEGVATSASPISLQIYTNPTDALATGASLVAGSLARVIGYVTQDAGFDSTVTSATLTAGSLTRVIGYVTLAAGSDFEIDSVSTSAVLTGGTLQRVIGYIDYDIGNEAVNTSATLIGGSLV